MCHIFLRNFPIVIYVFSLQPHTWAHVYIQSWECYGKLTVFCPLKWLSAEPDQQQADTTYNLEQVIEQLRTVFPSESGEWEGKRELEWGTKGVVNMGIALSRVMTQTMLYKNKKSVGQISPGYCEYSERDIICISSKSH